MTNPRGLFLHNDGAGGPCLALELCAKIKKRASPEKFGSYLPGLCEARGIRHGYGGIPTVGTWTCESGGIALYLGAAPLRVRNSSFQFTKRRWTVLSTLGAIRVAKFRSLESCFQRPEHLICVQAFYGC